MPEPESPVERGKKILEEEATADAEAARKFNPAKLIMDAAQIQTIKDPVLGEVKYTVLTTNDMFELSQYTTPIDQTKQTLYLLLHKAYPEIETPNDILKLPAKTVIRLGEIIAGPDNFFQLPKSSTLGLK